MLPTKRFPDLDKTDLVDGSLRRILSTKYDVKPTGTEEFFELVKVSADEARLLHVEEGATLIRVTGTTFDAEGTPVERCYSLWAGGVRFHIAYGHQAANRSISIDSLTPSNADA